MRRLALLLFVLTALSLHAQFPPPGPSCGTMSLSNLAIGYVGAMSGCTPTSGHCNMNEPLQFTIILPFTEHLYEAGRKHMRLERHLGIHRSVI